MCLLGASMTLEITKQFTNRSSGIFVSRDAKIWRSRVALDQSVQKANLWINDMSEVIPFQSKKIEVRKSPVHRFGVFATEDIPKGEDLEAVPAIIVPNTVDVDGSPAVSAKGPNKEGRSPEIQNSFFKDLVTLHAIFRDAAAVEGVPSIADYYFLWGEKHLAIPLGFGCLYNESKIPNANWDQHSCGFRFFATKDIKADEEVFVDYGKRILASDRRKFLFGF